MKNLHHLRRQYDHASLDLKDLSRDPITQFHKWFKAALASSLLDPHAMTLSTATKNGRPSSRMVLLKSFDHKGFVFFSNYSSRKGKELQSNPWAALNFYWDKLDRQVTITGRVSKISKRESFDYFRKRPLESQLAAWASAQSSILPSRAALEERVDYYRMKFKGKSIPLPPHWGGYCLAPISIEFWQGRPSRLNDRLLYSRSSTDHWEIQRLAP